MLQLDTHKSLKEFELAKRKEEGLLVYFSHEACNVCKVLKPKVKDMLDKEFPNMKMTYADTVITPEIAGQNGIFTVPTILVFFDGREYIRKSRNIGLEELKREIQRPYEMMFS